MRVNKISWEDWPQDRARPYKCFFGYLTVTADDIEVWTRYPDATFTLIAQMVEELSVGEELVKVASLSEPIDGEHEQHLRSEIAPTLKKVKAITSA